MEKNKSFLFYSKLKIKIINEIPYIIGLKKIRFFG
jgi:hypothetical protein